MIQELRGVLQGDFRKDLIVLIQEVINREHGEKHSQGGGR